MKIANIKITVPENFERGNCSLCPLHHYVDEIYGHICHLTGYEKRCLIDLEEQEKNPYKQLIFLLTKLSYEQYSQNHYMSTRLIDALRDALEQDELT